MTAIRQKLNILKTRLLAEKYFEKRLVISKKMTTFTL